MQPGGAAGGAAASDQAAQGLSFPSWRKRVKNHTLLLEVDGDAGPCRGTLAAPPGCIRLSANHSCRRRLLL